jgi:hypothetical protein
MPGLPPDPHRNHDPGTNPSRSRHPAITTGRVLDMPTHGITKYLRPMTLFGWLVFSVLLVGSPVSAVCAETFMLQRIDPAALHLTMLRNGNE